jgi:glycosyltransferase involved in cell wall biosynthesis
MKILFIENGLSNPFKVNNGGSQRTNLLLQACARIADVDVVTFYDESCTKDNNSYNVLYAGKIESHENRWNKLIRLIYAASPKGFATLNKEKERMIDSFMRQKQYDFIVVRYVNQAIECGLLKYGKRLVVDVDDSPHDAARRDAESARTLRNKLFYKTIAHFSKHALGIFVEKTGACFFSNYEQAKEFKGVFLPNVPFYTIKKESIDESLMIDGRILFVGDFCYFPNLNGASHFLETIYPQIIKKHPAVSLHLVGNVFEDKIEQWEKQGANVMGFVDDLVKEYAEAECVVIPLYTGAGTCIKVLEAMQMQRPIITTPTGKRGYDSFFEDGEDYLVANNDNDYAEKVYSILENRELRNRITHSAYGKYEKIFNKSHFFEIINNTLSKI